MFRGSWYRENEEHRRQVQSAADTVSSYSSLVYAARNAEPADPERIKGLMPLALASSSALHACWDRLRVAHGDPWVSDHLSSVTAQFDQWAGATEALLELVEGVAMHGVAAQQVRKVKEALRWNVKLSTDRDNEVSRKMLRDGFEPVDALVLSAYGGLFWFFHSYAGWPVAHRIFAGYLFWLAAIRFIEKDIRRKAFDWEFGWLAFLFCPRSFVAGAVIVVAFAVYMFTFVFWLVEPTTELDFERWLDAWDSDY